MAIVTEELGTKPDFVDLARRQKQFLGIILLILTVNAVALFAPPAQQAIVRGGATLLSLASLYFVYKLVAEVLPASGTWIIIADLSRRLRAPWIPLPAGSNCSGELWRPSRSNDTAVEADCRCHWRIPGFGLH